MSPVIGLSGSLRRDSYNTALLEAASALFPGRIEVVTPAGIPLYDADLEATEGLPRAVTELKNRLSAAGGLLIATPEYNNSMPGVLKNAFDWLTRPPADMPRVWHGLPVALTGATPGASGTALAQVAWLPVLRALKTRPYFGGRLQLSRAHRLFKKGRLADREARNDLRAFVAGFLEFAAKGR